MNEHIYKQNPAIYADVNKAYYKLAKKYGISGFSNADWAKEAECSITTCRKYFDDTFADYYSEEFYSKNYPSIEEIYQELAQECREEGIDNNLENNNKLEINYIYEIYHVNREKFPNKHYVGRTNDIIRRMNKEHFNPEYWIKSPSKLLYWNLKQDGIKNYAYRILEICSSAEEAKQKEEYWINKLHTMAIDGGFNERHEINN